MASEQLTGNQTLPIDKQASPNSDGADLSAQFEMRFLERTQRSGSYAQRHRQHHADKSSISAARAAKRNIAYPLVVTQADGARVTDLDGHEYTDILQGLGAHLCGHNPEFVRQAMAAQLQKGIAVGVQDEQVGELAALTCALTGLPRVTFSNTGTEAVMAAVRVARAATGRKKIAIFTNSYHGHNDAMLVRAPLLEYARRKVRRLASRRAWLAPVKSALESFSAVSAVPAAAGVPKSVAQDTVVLEYGSASALQYLKRKASRLAAVLVEPVQSRCPELQPAEFLHELRALTENAGCALVFDEMVTGFRVHPAGAQGFFGIKADLATYSKVLGGGMPISALAGRGDFMDAIDGGLDGTKATTFFAGTFCKHPMALATSKAMLSHLQAQGPALQQNLNAKTTDLVSALNQAMDQADIPVRFTSFGSFFSIAVTQSKIDQKTINALSLHLINENIFLRAGDRGGFLSTAHSADDIGRIAAAFQDGLHQLRSANAL